MGLQWMSKIVNLQMESTRRWNQALDQASADIRRRMVRLSPAGLGDFGAFDQYQENAIIEMTEKKLREAPTANLLREIADRLRAKMYFLNLDLGKSQFEVGYRRPVRLHVQQRRTENAAFPRPHVRRFHVLAEVRNNTAGGSLGMVTPTPYLEYTPEAVGGVVELTFFNSSEEAASLRAGTIENADDVTDEAMTCQVCPCVKRMTYQRW